MITRRKREKIQQKAQNNQQALEDAQNQVLLEEQLKYEQKILEKRKSNGFIYSKSDVLKAIREIQNHQFFKRLNWSDIHIYNYQQRRGQQNSNSFQLLKKQIRNNFQEKEALDFNEIIEPFQIIFSFIHQENKTKDQKLINFCKQITNAYNVFKNYKDYYSLSKVWRILYNQNIDKNIYDKYQKPDTYVPELYTQNENWLLLTMQQVTLESMNIIHKKQPFWQLWDQAQNQNSWLNGKNYIIHKKYIINNFYWTKNERNYFYDHNLNQHQVLKYIFYGKIQNAEGKFIMDATYQEYYTIQQLSQLIQSNYFKDKQDVYCYNCTVFINLYKQYLRMFKIRVQNLKRLDSYKLFRKEIIYDIFEQFFDKNKQQNKDENEVQISELLIQVLNKQNEKSSINEEKI